MFTELLDYINNLPGFVCLFGDMNIHFDDPLQSLAKHTLTTLNLYSLVRVINKHTHRCSHIIDRVVGQPDDDIHDKSTVADSLKSDHYCIKSYFNVSVSKPSTLYRTVRNIANIDRPSFIAELSSVSEFSSVVWVNQYCDFLRTVLDKHAPPSLWKVRNHNSSPWFESKRDELFIAKRERHQAERKWRNTKLTIFKDLYRQAEHKVSKLVHTFRFKFYTERIALASSSKELHQIVNTLQNRHSPKILPAIYPSADLPSIFINYVVVNVVVSSLVGDMNIHFDNPLQSLAKHTLTTLNHYSLVKVIDKPTHWCGHIIDRVVVQPDNDIHEKSTVADSLKSDHYCIKSYFNVSVSKPSTLYRTVRNIANIDRPSFIAELSSVSEFSSVVKVNQYCDFLRTVLDKHAPLSLWKVRNHNSSPLFE